MKDIDEKFDGNISKKCWEKILSSVRKPTNANTKVVFQLIPQKEQSFQKTYKIRMFKNSNVWSSGLSNKIKLIDYVLTLTYPRRRILHYPLPMPEHCGWRPLQSRPISPINILIILTVERNGEKRRFTLCIVDDIKKLPLYTHESLPDMIDDNVTLNHRHQKKVSVWTTVWWEKS